MRILPSLALVIALLSSCSDDDDCPGRALCNVKEPEPMLCQPGDRRICEAPSGCAGWTYCQDGRYTLGQCVCDGDGTSGAAGSAGSAGGPN
jgi:hypothetical protein